MSISVSMPTSSGAPSGRRVATRINGVEVTLPCPAWCTVDHSVENHAFVEDFSHMGASAEATAAGGEFKVEAYLGQYFAGDAHVVVADADGVAHELSAAEAESIANDLITLASRIRGMARTIGGAR
jgi:hypothetical protein